MGSTRLPGKVLLHINGQTILERAIRRLREARCVDEVAVLTTARDEDDEVVQEAFRLGAWVHRGPEFDVLKRFQQASEKFRPEIIIRATADNPLIDIGSTDRIVRALRSSRLEYCMEEQLPVGAATEAVTAAALEKVDRIATDPSDREHVTLYIKRHPEEFQMALLAPPDVLHKPDLRISVDTPEDFLFVEELIAMIPEKNRPVPLEKYMKHALTLLRAGA
jgi:spore coat polysaccharide biosynthesis protein SpsF